MCKNAVLPFHQRHSKSRIQCETIKAISFTSRRIPQETCYVQERLYILDNFLQDYTWLILASYVELIEEEILHFLVIYMCRNVGILKFWSKKLSITKIKVLAQILKTPYFSPNSKLKITLLVESLVGTNFRGYKLLRKAKVKIMFCGETSANG